MITAADVLRVFDGSTLVPERRQLRTYQMQSVDKLRAAFRSSKRVLLQSPVSSGKTDIAGFIVKAQYDRKKRVAFIAHRKELIDNAVDRLLAWGIPSNEIGVIRADDERTNAAAPVQVCSVASLARRDIGGFDFILVDESHRAAAASYARIFELSPEAFVLGVTASPLRTDGAGLGKYFNALVVGPQPSALIECGALAAPRIYAAPIEVKVTTAQMNSVEELGEIMSAPRIVGNVVAEYIRLSEGRRGFCFAASVNHSKTLTARFVEAGVRAVHVDGTTPDDEREAAFSALRAGTVDMLCSFGVAVEGVDIPAAKYAAIARPTTSLVVWLQSTGRVLRPYNGIVPIVSDHGGCCERLGWPTADREWSLTGDAVEKVKNEFHVCLHCFAYVPSTHPCPLCGKEAPSRQERAIEADEAVRLELQEKRDAEPESVRRRFFDAMARRAKLKGYLPGYVGNAFKQRWRTWPPWWQELQAEYNADVEWQARVAARKAGQQAAPEAWRLSSTETEGEST